MSDTTETTPAATVRQLEPNVGMAALSNPACTLELLGTLEGHTDRVWHVAIHPTRQLLATCSGDHTVRLWTPTRTGDSSGWVCMLILDDFTTRTVRCVEWSPDGRFLACASFDGKTTVFALKGGRNGRVSGATVDAVAKLEGHDNEAKGVAWCPSGTLLATCSRDHSVFWWHVGDGNPDSRDFDCASVQKQHKADVKAVRWHPSRDLLFSASYDNTVRVWTESASDDSDWICLQELAGHTSTVWGMGFSPDGVGLATVSDDSTMCLWVAGKPPPAVAPRTVDSLWYRPACPPITGAHADQRAIYSVDWSPTLPVPAGHEGSVSVIATAGGDNSVQLYVPSGIAARRGAAAAANGGVNDAAPDTALLLATYVNAGGVPHAHAGDINCVRWHPRDAGIVFTAGDDFLVKVWRFAWTPATAARDST